MVTGKTIRTIKNTVANTETEHSIYIYHMAYHDKTVVVIKRNYNQYVINPKYIVDDNIYIYIYIYKCYSTNARLCHQPSIEIKTSKSCKIFLKTIYIYKSFSRIVICFVAMS